MPTYITYQCTVCRRVQDKLKDDRRATPNYCTITKGCLGNLFPISEQESLTRTEPVAGLDDWYPRGTVRATQSQSEVKSNQINLSSSSRGEISLALLLTSTEKDALGSTVNLTFEQRVIGNISFTQYVSKVTQAGVSTISGRDVNSKNIRFSQVAIDENRVSIRVNGVDRFPGTDPDEFTLSPDIVTFNEELPIGALVTITVYQEKSTIDKVITFTFNDFIVSDITQASNAWQNIRYVESLIDDASIEGRARWWILTASGTDIQQIPNGAKLRFISNSAGILEEDFSSKVRFLLSLNPYQPIDRIKTFVVNGAAINKDFILTVSGASSSRKLYVDDSAVDEVYPPLVILQRARPSSDTVGASFIFATSEVSSLTSVQDTEIDDPVVKSKYILGPI